MVAPSSHLTVAGRVGCKVRLFTFSGNDRMTCAQANVNSMHVHRTATTTGNNMHRISYSISCTKQWDGIFRTDSGTGEIKRNEMALWQSKSERVAGAKH